MGVERLDRVPLLFGTSPIDRLERLSEHLGGADLGHKQPGPDERVRRFAEEVVL